MARTINPAIKEGSVLLTINPQIYPLDVIFTVCYIFLEDNYIMLDGDKTKEVIVQIRPKEKGKDLKNIAGEFSNQLVNYVVYKNQLEQNKEIKQAIMQRVLITNSTPIKKNDDFENINLPWENDKGNKE